FLDEPTAGVDPASRRRFWERIHELARGGTTILVTTHYMDEASQCTRLAFLSRGHLIAAGTPAEIPALFGQTTIEDVVVSLQNTGNFDIVGSVASRDAIRIAIERGDAHAALVIPPDFAAKLQRGHGAQAQVIVDAADPLSSSAAISAAAIVSASRAAVSSRG